MKTILAKLTATLLLTLMVAVAATSQGGVLYCHCLDTLTVGSCGCEVVDQVPKDDHGGTEVEEHSCHCHHEAEPVEKARPTAGPHDCNAKLFLALGKFCGTSPSFPALDELSEGDNLSRAGWEDEALSFGTVEGSWSCRPPPDHPRSQTVPLYLRHLVFLV